MDFAIKEDGRKLFELIKEDLVALSGAKSPDFDILYFCFIAGVTANRKGDESNSIPLIDYFPGNYRDARGNLLIALFLVHQLRHLGVTMDEKKTVRDHISRLVDPTAPNSLSDEGVREFNRFAHGGCEVLIEWFSEDRPRSLQVFLRIFNEKIKETQHSSKAA